MLLINRRYIRGYVGRAGNDLFLKLVLEDWDRLYVRKDERLALISDEHDGTYRVMQAIRCPGGEPEAWVILRPVEPLPKGHEPAEEARRAFAVQFNEAPILQA